jgi:hypothetical protein
MSSYEWMELQTLTSDIAASRARLVAARSAKDNRLARVLEQEISEAERRRDLLLANITNQVAGPVEETAAPQPIPIGAPPPLEPAAADPPENAEPEQPMPSPYEASAGIGASPPAATARPEGESAVWDQLTPGDIQNAKDELATRRAEILARHDAELKALDADQGQLDTLAEAIELFARKFKLPMQAEAANADVVTLEEQRELRQGRA